jgi:hypothetical protein
MGVAAVVWGGVWLLVKLNPSTCTHTHALPQVVSEYTSQLGARLGQVLGTSLTRLDGRFSTVRMEESNLANLLCDVFRRACSADVCIMNSGTFRCVFVCVCVLCVCVWGGGGTHAQKSPRRG